jgi:hypothetical protein
VLLESLFVDHSSAKNSYYMKATDVHVFISCWQQFGVTASEYLCWLLYFGKQYILHHLRFLRYCAAQSEDLNCTAPEASDLEFNLWWSFSFGDLGHMIIRIFLPDPVGHSLHIFSSAAWNLRFVSFVIFQSIYFFLFSKHVDTNSFCILKLSSDIITARKLIRIAWSGM